MNSVVDNKKETGAAPTGTLEGSLFHVLVVEDDPFIRNLNIKVLVRAGYTVDSAGDGQEGWEALCAKNYDLLITDYNMPRMDGMELIKRVRLAHKNLPIIFATGAALSEDMIQDIWFSSVSLLQKPFVNTQLLEKAKAALALNPPVGAV